MIYSGRAATTRGAISSPEESDQQRWFTPAGADQLLAGGHIHDALTQLALLRHRAAPDDLSRSP